jgi:hypothetical protein
MVEPREQSEARPSEAQVDDVECCSDSERSERRDVCS